MEGFKSKYTGEEVEERLDKVSQLEKDLNKTKESVAADYVKKDEILSAIDEGSITEGKLSDEVREKLNQGGGSGGQGEKGEDGKSAYEIWLEQGNSGSEQDFLYSLKGEKGDQGDKGDKMTYDDLSEEDKEDLASRVPTPEIPDGSVTEEKLSESVVDSLDVMKNKLDILYKVALTFSGGGNKKKGTSVNVTLSWTVKVNGTSVNPSSQTLNGEVLDVTLRKKTFTGVTEDTTYTLVVDGVQATQSVKFFNPSYFGVVSPDYQVSSDVSGLTEQTNYGSRSLTKTASASGSMKVVYLYPSALGSLTSIKDGNNFDITGSFTKTTDITINGEKYIAYLLTQEANINGLTFKFT